MTALRGRALAEATLAHIEAHPEEWMQGFYRCGTKACFAGHAILLAGGRWARPSREWSSTVAASKDRPEEHALTRAVHLLGIPRDLAESSLFDADNTLDDLRRIVAEIWPPDGTQ